MPSNRQALENNNSSPVTSSRRRDSTGKKPNSPRDRSLEEKKDLEHANLYKTELCRSFLETGHCRYSWKCQFAHGFDELRPILRPSKYKTEICKTFHTIGTCPYGTRCRFIHREKETNQVIAEKVIVPACEPAEQCAAPFDVELTPSTFVPLDSVDTPPEIFCSRSRLPIFASLC